MTGRAFVPTSAGPEALHHVEAVGRGDRTATAVIVDGPGGRIVMMARGRGVQLGPLGAEDLSRLAVEIAEAALERQEVEDRLAVAAEAALAKALN